jgi:hypothetical protein
MLTNVEVVAPTGLEYWALRAVQLPAHVRRSGVGLANWRVATEVEAVVTCGLAGSLISSLIPGTVHIPDLVRSPTGEVARCDPSLRVALIGAARSIGFNPETGPLLTAATIVTGSDRDAWSRRGFVAADMETGLLISRVPRFAAIRVILDSPERSISDRWLAPSTAVLRPTLWPELLWLVQAAPRYALRAARVLKAGLVEGQAGMKQC